MQRTNETAQSGTREMLSNLLTTISTVALIAIVAMQVPDLLIWLAR
jgi:hypothetical protein